MITFNLILSFLPCIIGGLLLLVVISVPDQYGYGFGLNLGLIAGVLLIIVLILTGLAFVFVDETTEYDVQVSNTSLFVVTSDTALNNSDYIFSKVDCVNNSSIYSYYFITNLQNRIENQSYLLIHCDVVKTLRLGILNDENIYMNEHYVLSVPSTGFSFEINENALNADLLPHLWQYQDYSNVTVTG